MTDTELMGQLTTFILAGHETTATALTWALWKLAERPLIQQKLRDEIRVAKELVKTDGLDEIGSEDLASLEYLDAFVVSIVLILIFKVISFSLTFPTLQREILRLESPVANTLRAAGKDDSIPLGSPLKLKDGTSITSIPVKKGQNIFLSIVAVNTSQTVFGEDALEFKPERWINNNFGEKGPAVGVWSHQLTFLAGPRACIGYKFALLELKALVLLLFTMKYFY